MQLTEAAPLYVPAPHDVHVDEPRATPAVALPAPHSRHELWPDADWYRPSLQFVHLVMPSLAV